MSNAPLESQAKLAVARIRGADLARSLVERLRAGVAHPDALAAEGLRLSMVDPMAFTGFMREIAKAIERK